MTTATRETTSRRWVLPFLAALVAVLATVFGSATASAATTGVGETRVGASAVAVDVLVEPPQHVGAGQRLGEAVAGPQIVVATGVAAKNVPHGFAGADEFANFSTSLRGGLRQAGYDDVTPIFQGSSVTGSSYRTGAPFDSGRVSDFDIALASPSLLERASGLGIGLRSGGARTGPLRPADLQRLGLSDLSQSLSGAAGRPVNFMIYGSRGAAISRGPSLVAP